MNVISNGQLHCECNVKVLWNSNQVRWDDIDHIDCQVRLNYLEKKKIFKCLSIGLSICYQKHSTKVNRVIVIRQNLSLLLVGAAQQLNQQITFKANELCVW